MDRLEIEDWVDRVARILDEDFSSSLGMKRIIMEEFMRLETPKTTRTKLLARRHLRLMSGMPLSQVDKLWVEEGGPMSC